MWDTTSFIHLHVRSEYSLKDSLVRVSDLIKQCVTLNMPAVALTDHMNIFAAVKFYRAAIAHGIKPIIGAELAILDGEETSLCVALSQNEIGYKHLRQLITRAYREGQSQGTPFVTKSWLTEYSEGLIILSGGIEGDVAKAIINGNLEKANQLCQFWKTHFGDRYYLQLERVGKPQEALSAEAIAELALSQDIPLVACNDVCMITQEQFEAHEARVCIYRGDVLNDDSRKRDYYESQYLQSQQTMQQRFSDIPQALTNSVEIAKRCNVKITLDKTFLPYFPVPSGMDEASYLRKLASEGLKARVAASGGDAEKIDEAYTSRLDIELDVIVRMGFAGYFLIVADFIQWAKSHDVPVGPGRGSGAGSLVAYALQITDLDPLNYDLLFERFLNPERVSMPDFDIDFCMEGRDRVIEYVATRYGRDNVSQIITYGTMAAKAVVRDVGRVLGHPYGFVDKIAKLIPFEIGMTLDKALEAEVELNERYQNEEEVKVLIDLARQLEGLTRNAGKHAGGVVIAPSPLTDFTALYCEPDAEQAVSQFDKDDVETIGLVKFDFLGLRTLTIIDWALKIIKQSTQKDIDITMIPLDDEHTFKLLKACQTTAVFQLESRGMKDLIKRLKPDCFEDIIALVALFRPGPLQSGMVDDFIERKHGLAQVAYAHPCLEPILRPTYGVILYQEQVMQIARVMAGYSLGGADLLRRAMGKKKPEEMAKQREIFLKGAKENDIDTAIATYVFDLMEKFAGYGFNKSHSAAYALISYQTAWLKSHYPAAYMAAVLSADMDNTDKVVNLIRDCEKLGLTILPPDVNHSAWQFTLRDDKTINYGLGAIKGVGESAVELIIKERDADAEFKDLFEFCERLDLRKVNRRVCEALIQSGAMDTLGPSRAVLMASLDSAQRHAEQRARDADRGQNDLFADTMTTETKPTFEQVPAWTELQRLQAEKATLGHYLSGHPLETYLSELKHMLTCRLHELSSHPSQTVTTAGLVTSVRRIQTKNNSRLVIVTIEDNNISADAVLFNDAMNEARELLVKDQLIIVTGEVGLDNFSGQYRLRVERIESLTDARARLAKAVHLHWHAETMQKEAVHTIKAICKQHRGDCPLTMHYQTPEARVMLIAGHMIRISPDEELLRALFDVVGKGNVELVY